jgi:S1-C subfamily serine protease
VLQIDSYATHGSSGSPVFDARGEVVGVIYAGPREAQGRIVYAVPSPHIVALINGRD